MPKGIKSYGRKQRREQRRVNHIAKDLGSPKYRQRIKEPKVKKPPIDEFEWDDDDGAYYWDDHPVDENGEPL